MQSFLVSEERVREALAQVYDPELGVNVVDLGLIYGIAIENGSVEITMTMTTLGCPLHEALTEGARRAVSTMVPGVEHVDVKLVWEPAWTPDLMSPDARRALGWE
jgi:metal-sulfur cluster biosynthetic enzyme